MQVKEDLAADDFDNGRTPTPRCVRTVAVRRVARDGERVVGMARLLSDGVCNAYLVDVWTRRRTAGAASPRRWCGSSRAVPGKHVGLQTDDAQGSTSARLSAAAGFLSLVVGAWLDNDANRWTEGTGLARGDDG